MRQVFKCFVKKEKLCKYYDTGGCPDQTTRNTKRARKRPIWLRDRLQIDNLRPSISECLTKGQIVRLLRR